MTFLISVNETISTEIRNIELLTLFIIKQFIL